MSKYQVDKVLREALMSDDANAAFAADPAAFLAGRELSDVEREALIARDYPKLYAGGAHPFLLNLFAIRQWPTAEILQRQMAYIRALADLGYPDFST